MREIKFRAWDKDFKGWIPEESLIINKGKPIAVVHNVGIPIQEAFQKAGKLINPDWELMQYTGLKDKNGKEIYEGDILKFNPLNPKQNGYDSHDLIAVIVYSSFGTMFRAKTEMGNIQFYGEKYSEVIGNIHEATDEQKKEWGI